MKKIIFILMLAIALGSYSCIKDQVEERPEFYLETPDLISDEDYEIYSLILNQSSKDKIIIAQTSQTNLSFSNHGLDENFLEDNPDFDLSLYDNLIELSEPSISFGENFVSDDIEIKVISAKELSYIFNSTDSAADWTEFHEEYNSSDIMRFTRIAYNESRTQSILECGFSGYKSGSGCFYYLKKQDDNWIVKDFRVWIDCY